MKASKIAYKPVGMALGALSSVLAEVIFKQVWKAVGHEEDAPDAPDEERRWSEVLSSPVLQGAILTVVKTADDHAGAATTYYGVLSIFPALLALVSILGLLGAGTIRPLIDNLGSLVPGTARDILTSMLGSWRATRAGRLSR